MTYQQFVEKNKSNKENFDKAYKQGESSPAQLNLSPYFSFSIESVNFKRGDGIAEISSKLRDAHTNTSIASIVNNVLGSDFVHVTNPSRIKGWRGFEE